MYIDIYMHFDMFIIHTCIYMNINKSISIYIYINIDTLIPTCCCAKKASPIKKHVSAQPGYLKNLS